MNITFSSLIPSSSSSSSRVYFNCRVYFPSYSARRHLSVTLLAWCYSSVSQFRRRVSMVHAFCLDNNLYIYINDLQTEHSDCVNVRCLIAILC